MNRYTVALRDPLSGRYGSRIGYKAGSPAEAVLRAFLGSRRHTTLPAIHRVTDVEHLGGDRYQVGANTYRVEVASIKSRTYKNITQIVHANKVLGHHFFDRDTMRFFRSIVHPGVYGGRYFITSEQFVASDGEEFPRQYTVREAHDDGSIETVNMGKFMSLDEAKSRIKLHVARVDVVH